MELTEEQKLLNSSNSSITALVPGGVVTTQNISTVIRPKVNSNSLQFVKIQTPELSKKAVEQIRIADETKISKEKIKEVEEEWQNNLLNWKSKRRQQLSHSVDYEPDQSSDNNNDCGSRKVKTFAEMIEQRAKSGNRLSFHLQRYAGTEGGYEDDDSKLTKGDDSADEDENGSYSSSSELERPQPSPKPIAYQAQARQISPPVEQAPSQLPPMKQELKPVANVQEVPTPVKQIQPSPEENNNPPPKLSQPSPPVSEERSPTAAKKTFSVVKPIPPPNKPNPSSVVRISPPLRQAPVPVYQSSPQTLRNPSPNAQQVSPPVMRTSTPVTNSLSTPTTQPSPPVKQIPPQFRESPQPIKQILSPVVRSLEVKAPSPPPPPPPFKQTHTLTRESLQSLRKTPPPPIKIAHQPVKEALPQVMRSCQSAVHHPQPTIAPTSPLRTPSISPRVGHNVQAAIPPEFAPGQKSQPTKPNREDKDKTVLSISGKKRCSSCKEELGRGAAAFVVESLSLVYHTNCFRCSVCHMNLSNGFRGVDVRVHAGQLHCQNCYSKDGLSYSRV